MERHRQERGQGKARGQEMHNRDRSRYHRPHRGGVAADSETAEEQ